MRRLSVVARRRIFWAYATALFIATHYPKLDIRVPGVERPDLIVHFGLFGTWYLLLFASEYLRRGGTTDWRAAAISWVVAVAYACLDEGLQLIPALGRHAAWDDLAANVTGISLASLVAAAWLMLRSRGSHPESAT